MSVVFMGGTKERRSLCIRAWSSVPRTAATVKLLAFDFTAHSTCVIFIYAQHEIHNNKV